MGQVQKDHWSTNRIIDSSISRRTLLRRMGLVAIGGSTLATILAACGGETSGNQQSTGTTSGGTGGATVSPTAADGTSTSTAPAPQGGSVTAALSVSLDTLDPAQMVTTMLMAVAHVMYDSLAYLDVENQLSPALATKWEVGGDGLTWTFNLRPDVKFHDGGTLDADAVKKTYDRALDPETNLFIRSFIDPVAEVIVIDPATVQFRTETVMAPIVKFIAHPDLGILSPKTLEQSNEEIGQNAAGAGPYKVKSYPSTDRLELVRFADYWGEPGGVDTLTFLAVPDANARMAMLQAGEADVVVNVPPQLISTLESTPGLEILSGKSSRVAAIYFNVQKPQWKDPQVRQALNHAVDVPTIISSVMRGFATAYPSPFTPLSFGYAEIKSYEYDPQKAIDLLAQAGWTTGSDGKLSPDGTPFTMTIDVPLNRYLLAEQTTEAVVGYLQKIGINAVSRQMEWSAFSAKFRDPAAQETTDCLYMAFADPNGDLSFPLETYDSRNWAPIGNNWGFYKNEVVDEMADKGIRSTNDDERAEYYKRAQQAIVDDAPQIFLFGLTTIAGQRSGVTGVEINPTESYLFDKASKK